MSGNSRPAVVVALLPAAVVLALFVGIMTGQSWAVVPVVLGAGGIVAFTVALAYLVNLAGHVGIAGGMARIVTHRDLVVEHVDEGDVEKAAKHEGGHAEAIVANGGHVSEARVFPDGSGYVCGSIPGKSEGGKHAWLVREVAVSLAGGMSVGDNPFTHPSCRSDAKVARYHLDKAGAAREAVLREATDNARRNMHGGYARRVERALIRRGRF